MTKLSGSVLIVDDDLAVGKVLAALMTQNGLDSVHAPSAEQALGLLDRTPFDLVIADLRMPGMDGMQLLRTINTHYPGLPVVILTAHGSVPLAVEAMRLGAADFVLKPFDRDELLFVLHKALTSSQASASQAPAFPSPTTPMVGASSAMQDVYRLIQKVAASPASVLIRGETGTGKELVARAVHDLSPRKCESFVRVHCAALPETLLESELFGYERGAFTGAASRKPGRFELAHRGTLFLDEIGDITPATQTKLLRVLQEREFERVGGTQTVKVDVRLIAATHRNLESMVESGQFRSDLYYRLNVIPILVPPLRDRPEDIEALAHHFCLQFGQANCKPTIRINPDAMSLLTSQSWPGNVRQLQNLVERLVVLSEGPTICRLHVQREMGPLRASLPCTSVDLGSCDSETLSLGSQRREAEKQALIRTLSQANNNRTLTARLLNVSRRTLYNKLKELGIE